MVKCTKCGHLNEENIKMCSSCQAEINEGSLAMNALVAEAEGQFQKDYLMSLDRSRMTYICTVCGEVNILEHKVCQKCGKPRPRSEYIKALQLIKYGKSPEIRTKTADEIIVGNSDVTEPIVAHEEKPNTEVTPADGLKLYRFVPSTVMSSDYGDINRQIIQPIVIVPYVNQNQPLWQYNPQQILKFVPNAPAEEVVQAPQTTAVQAQPNTAPSDEIAKVVSKRRTPLAKTTGLLTFIVAISLFATLMLGSFRDGFGFSLIGDTINAIISGRAIEVLDVVMLVSGVFALAATIIMMLYSIYKIFASRGKGLILVSVICLIMTVVFSTSVICMYGIDNLLSSIIAIALALIMLIVSILSAVKNRKK